MGKNISKKISKNLSGKYSQKFLGQLLYNLQQMHSKLFQKRAIQKVAEVTGYK